jgi:hypothetical protein
VNSHQFMIRTRRLKPLSIIVLFCVSALLSSDARAQVRFVQITDPHIFDDTSDSADNRWSDKAALISFIEKINQQVENKAIYRFIVVTGDLGLDKLVADIADRKEIESNIRTGATELASMLVLSKVRHWLFVPGDNDLLNEELRNIEYYHLFMQALRDAAKKTVPDFEIEDLCPKAEVSSGDYRSRSHLFKADRYAFIGFDNSSFRNSNGDARSNKPGEKRIASNAEIQKSYADHVRAHLDRDDISYAYVFYHIPAIDDPHLATQRAAEPSAKTGNAKVQLETSYLRSAWRVKSQVRVAWNRVVIHPKVKGLFAGHFHDHRKQTYQSMAWLTPDYLPEEVQKLRICPPLSLKLQTGKPEQARGFQEVYLDEEGNVSTRIVWFSEGAWTVNPAQQSADAAATEQFELGHTYESLGRLKEAEAAYAKAADSDWPPTRTTALEGLSRVVAAQDPKLKKYLPGWLSSPLVTSASTLWTGFVTAVMVVAIGLFGRFGMKRFGKWRGRNKVQIGPVVDAGNGNAGVRFDQIATRILERMHAHFKNRALIRGTLKLPLLARSQSPEIKQLIDAAAPGEIGKLLGWFYSLTMRPRYSIEGIVDSGRLWYRWLSISLYDEGNRVQAWKKLIEMEDLIAEETKLAFDALKRLIRHMNQ